MKRTTGQKKNKKQRGFSSHGWGSKKKHRGSGNRGGKGNAGSGKRADTKKPTLINLYGTVDLAKRGFVRPDAKKIIAINLRDVRLMLEKNNVKELDLNKLGYSKLLGTGNLSQAVKITVKMASNSAIEKVKSAGGEVILTK
ncbi:MAG: uL15 family ribosomal protein [Nanoarchaeota archaeon]|nr:uL15 family ribosomal protein [Nanoarchaeota archaeon]